MNERLTIIQPGRIGDILLVLPIAYSYYKNGFDIIWPVANEYVNIFRNINFLSHMFVYNIGSIYEHTGKYLKNNSIRLATNPYIDLAIGFGDIELDKRWRETKLSFDTWKYSEAKLEYQKKYDLCDFIARDLDKEIELMKFKGINKGDYIVIHEDGSHGRHFDFNRIIGYNHIGSKIIKIDKEENYNIFDWLKILEGAKAIYCVDSCIANLVDQYGIMPPKGRFFHPWREYYTPLQLSLLTPKIKEDWVII